MSCRRNVSIDWHSAKWLDALNLSPANLGLLVGATRLRGYSLEDVSISPVQLRPSALLHDTCDT